MHTATFSSTLAAPAGRRLDVIAAASAALAALRAGWAARARARAHASATAGAQAARLDAADAHAMRRCAPAADMGHSVACWRSSFGV